MQLPYPIHISFFEFLASGKFDCIEIGQTKEWILNNFPDPDHQNPMARKSSIWLYGNIEFHFNDNVLFMIYADHLCKISAGAHIHFDQWILNDSSSLSLSKIQQTFNEEGWKYLTEHDKNLNLAHIHLIKSGVSLNFEPIHENDTPNNYLLHAFNLKQR